MSTITVTTNCGTSKEFDTRREAERGKRTHESLCDECDEADVRLTLESERSALESASSDERAAASSEDEADSASDAPRPASPDRTTEPVSAERLDSVQTDPLDVVPDYMITEVEGQPTITKRGYAVIANHFDIVVRSEAITTAGETDHEYAEFRATAWERGDDPANGYTGHATARASEDRRGIEDNLNEMAETRAMKRAVAWASGVGLLAWEEMAGYLEEE